MTAAVLEGLGAMVPPRVVTNEDLSRTLDTTDEWIRTRTGIGTRHWAGTGVSTGDLAVVAGERALKSAGTPAIDMVVLATSTPDHPCPATAPEVSAKLGLGDIPAFDVAAVCAGFVYALSTAAGAIATGQAERVLVIGADTWSTRINPADRGTAVIFGDGAGAMVLRAGEPDEPGALAGFDLGSDGTGKELVGIPAGGSRQRSTKTPPLESDSYLYMHGKEVFTHAVNRMANSSSRLLDRLGWSTGGIDWFVGHQANARILHAIADLLDVDHERVVLNLDRVGNTSAASIPLAMADAAGAGRFAVGDRLLLTAFGAGLVWGSAALRWPDLTVG